MEQEIDQMIVCEVDAGEKCPRPEETNVESNSTGAVASTSDVHELPKEMHEMKIREDKTDDHDDMGKVC